MGGRDSTRLVPGDRNPLELQRGRTMRFSLCRTQPRVHMLELEDALFHFDSAVLMPAGPADDPSDPDDPRPEQTAIVGLAAIATVLAFSQEHPGKRLLVAGHTDTSGGDDYNQGLSELRAQNALALINGERSDWVNVCLAKHRVEDWQQILKWLADVRGWNTDPGVVDNIYGPNSQGGLDGFRTTFQERFGRAAGTGNGPNRADWEAFYEVYQDELARTLGVTAARLATFRPVSTLDPAAVGCGERFPTEHIGLDGHRCAANRRVELLFFDEGEAPDLRCHDDEDEPCELYDPDHGRCFSATYLEVTPANVDRADIDTDEDLFAQFFVPATSPSGAHPDKNLYNTTQREAFAATLGGDAGTAAALQNLKDRQAALLAAGTIIEDADHDLLVPLNGSLMVPDGATAGSAPLVLILHGMHGAGFFADGRSETPLTREFRDYEGYVYLQAHLAQHGLASLSIDLNIVDDTINVYAHRLPEELMRVQIALLWLLLLETLQGRSSLGAGDKLLLVLPDGATAPVRLPTVLADGALPAKLQELRENAAKLNLDVLGFLGHSRGGPAVLSLFQFFSSSAGRAPTLQLNERHAQVEQRNLLLAQRIGHPLRSRVKCLIPLEPSDGLSHRVDHADTFLFVLAGANDEDVGPGQADVYDNPSFVGPRALVFLHGGTHARFNRVWAGSQNVRDRLQARERCGNVLLSNAEHEAAAEFYLGGALRAIVGSESNLIRRLTGEQAPPAGIVARQDWELHHPDSAPRLRRELKLEEVAVSLPSGARHAHERLTESYSSTGDFCQVVTVIRITIPASAWGAAGAQRVTATVAPPDDEPTLDLGAFTHLGLRLAKQYDARNPVPRAAEPLANYRLGLFGDSGQLGQWVAGADVPRPILRVHPHLITGGEAGDNCEDQTINVLQRIEVPLSQFGSGLSFARVRRVALDLLQPSGKTTDDIACVTDFRLSRWV